MFVGEVRLVRSKLRDSDSQSRNERFALVDQVGRELHTGKWGLVFRKRFAMFLFVTMCGNQIGAVGRAVKRDLAFSAATGRADFLTFGRAKSLRPPFGTNRAYRSLEHFYGTCRSPFPKSGAKQSVYPTETI